jgi:hypothetical protein
MDESMTSNPIPARQNAEPQLKVLRARQWTYVVATRFMVLQIVLTVLLPIVGAVVTLFVPTLRPHFAALALTVLVLDAIYLDRRYKDLLKRGAKLGEKFDCTVLSLPWNSFVAGDEPEAEEIRSGARSFAARRDDAKIVDWYPLAAGEMPLSLGRIVCQRTNLRYDSQLRRSFGAVIVTVVALVIGGLVVAGLLQNLNLTAWILTLAPATPLLSWAGREYYRQRDTADLLDELMKKARAFWRRALAGECDDDSCLGQSREFQNAIYLRRSTSPLVMPYLYTLKRLMLEDEMNDAANDFLEAYRKKQAGD